MRKAIAVPLRWLGTSAERLWDRLLCVAGAVVFSQLPEFFQQYLQRLGGHLDEARRQLEQFRQAAMQSGMTLNGLIADAGAQPNPAMERLGHVAAETQARVDALASAELALRGASAWSRPFVWLRHFDPAIARATWSVFRPAVPTTGEGLIYALAGLIAALVAYHAVAKPAARCVFRRRSAAEPARGQP